MYQKGAMSKVTRRSAELAEANLSAMVKSYMFIDKKPVAMTNNRARLKAVMQAFNCYEINRIKVNEVSKVIKRIIQNHFTTMFMWDFPFYILLVYRIHM